MTIIIPAWLLYFWAGCVVFVIGMVAYYFIWLYGASKGWWRVEK